MNTAIKAGLLVGLVAGLLTGLFHLAFSEPVIDDAIAIEERFAQAGDHDDEVFSRNVQKAGMVVGWLVFGGVAGAFAATVYRFTAGRNERYALRPSLAFALLVYWAVFFLPFWKYPANPPGVGDPDTIDFRQGAYLGFAAISLAATAGAWLLARFWQGQTPVRRYAAIAIVYGLAIGLAFWLMPGHNDPNPVPTDLLWKFRSLSLIGQAVFWTLVGLWLPFALRRLSQTRPSATHLRPYIEKAP